MRLDDEETEVKSYAGLICSALVLIVICTYAFLKMDVLMHNKDKDVRSVIHDQHFDRDFVFSSKNGLNLAVAFTAYDNEREWILEPAYGDLLIQSYEWGPNPDGTYITKRTPLNTHVCTREELGINEDRSKARFLPLRELEGEIVELYQRKLLCADPEDLFIFGDYNAMKAR